MTKADHTRKADILGFVVCIIINNPDYNFEPCNTLTYYFSQHDIKECKTHVEHLNCVFRTIEFIIAGLQAHLLLWLPIIFHFKNIVAAFA